MIYQTLDFLYINIYIKAGGDSIITLYSNINCKLHANSIYACIVSYIILDSCTSEIVTSIVLAFIVEIHINIMHFN